MNMPAGLLHIAKSFTRGIRPPAHKESTCALPIRRLPFAPEVVVPLLQHTGSPAVPCVKVGQEVVRGEPIAKANGFMSVPMHAPVTGVVASIELRLTSKGEMLPAIVIHTYMGASQEVLYSAPQDVDAMTPSELVAAVRETGVVGLGGAAFPTHVKLVVPEGRQIDTVLVNGCECESYLTTDHRVMLECADDIHAGIQIVQKAVGATRAIIVTEDNKLDAVKSLNASRKMAPTTAISVLKPQYPQGAEKLLTKVVLDREVPSGGSPADAGVAVLNVATLAQLGEVLPRRQGLIERVITITGPGVEHPGNYMVALGTPLSFALKHAGLRPDTTQVIFGGPMTGHSVADLDIPITKGITGILVLTEAETAKRPTKIYPCIKCGYCIDACPIQLNPSRLGLLAQRGHYEAMESEFHLNDCFECGCCTYVCPSHIPLVQEFRIAKAMNRQRKTAQ